MRFEKTSDQLLGPQFHFGLNIQMGLIPKWAAKYEKNHSKFIKIVVVFLKKSYSWTLYFNKHKRN